jgi:hypothetical protein
MMNLHDIVRSAIRAVNPDEDVLLYQAVGEENRQGLITAQYGAPLGITAQFQPTSDALSHSENMSTTTLTIEAFLYSDAAQPVSGIARRPIARTGDFIKRGSVWLLVTNVIEDWSPVGWANVELTEQAEPPAGIADLSAVTLIDCGLSSQIFENIIDCGGALSLLEDVIEAGGAFAE